MPVTVPTPRPVAPTVSATTPQVRRADEPPTTGSGFLVGSAVVRAPAHAERLGFALADLESDSRLLTLCVAGDYLVVTGVDGDLRH